MATKSNTRFRVLQVDDDGTAEVKDLNMSREAEASGLKAVGRGGALEASLQSLFQPTMLCACWCRPNRPLEEGQIVEGSFSFDPNESLQRGELPTLHVKETKRF